MQTRSQTSILRRTRRVAVAALAVGSCLGALAVCGPQPAQAQAGATAGSKKVSLNLVQQPVQTALRLLFSSVGLNNSIDQDVQGLVTINVNDVSFDVALRALLNAANPPLTYDNNGGVYHVSVKRDLPPVIQAPQPAQSGTQTAEGIHAYRIPIDHYDAGIIAQIAASAGRGGVIIVPPNNVAGSGGQGGANGSGGRGGGGFGGGGQGGGFGGGSGGFGGGGNSFGGGMGGGSFGGGSMGGMGGGSMGGGFGGF